MRTSLVKKKKYIGAAAGRNKFLLLIKNLSKFKQCPVVVPDYLAGSLLGR